MNVRPLHDRIIVQRTEEQEQKVGGIVLPDTAKEKPQEGVIIAAGSGRVLDSGERLALEVHVGNKVLYAKYAGTEIKIDGEELLILSEKDVLAIVED